jgi:hypothetical protein
MLAPNKQANQTRFPHIRENTRHAKNKLHDHAWQGCQGLKDCRARLRAAVRANPSRSRGRYSHRCFNVSTPFLCLFFSPSLVSQARTMPYCQHAFISKNHANSCTQFARPLPAILATRSRSLVATPNPAIIDAVTICEVINLTITPPIPGESRPAFLHDHVPHCRRSDHPII